MDAKVVKFRSEEDQISACDDFASLGIKAFPYDRAGAYMATIRGDHDKILLATNDSRVVERRDHVD